MKQQYFVTGIGTDVGKTFICALLCKYLKADYWKPIQAGILPFTDSEQIRKQFPECIIHKESYSFNTPASPHYAAFLENIQIDFENIKTPKTSNNLIIEGAGGLMVPLNNYQTILDLIKHLNCKVIIVANEYLGAINHTLMSIKILQTENIPIAGLVWNNYNDDYMLNYILEYSKIPLLAKVPYIKNENSIPQIVFNI
jgi:dethiobiotin synthetase